MLVIAWFYIWLYTFLYVGYFLTVDTDFSELNTSSFKLPEIKGPASVHVVFHAYYNGPGLGYLLVR